VHRHPCSVKDRSTLSSTDRRFRPPLRPHSPNTKRAIFIRLLPRLLHLNLHSPLLQPPTSIPRHLQHKVYLLKNINMSRGNEREKARVKAQAKLAANNVSPIPRNTIPCLILTTCVERQQGTRFYMLFPNQEPRMCYIPERERS
jgi:hypothetical protein